MPQYDFRRPRLFVDAPLAAGATVALGRGQAVDDGLQHLVDALAGLGRGQHRVRGVQADDVLDLLADPLGLGGRQVDLVQDRHDLVVVVDGLVHVGERLGFHALKHARLDYMVQKAVEMGASSLQPVVTRFTQVSRVNGERMRANVIEAAEQCGILNIAAVAEPLPLERYLGARDKERLLVFCDESAEPARPVTALQGQVSGSRGIDVLIGPEGGFAQDERAMLVAQKRTLTLSLGPRILRADTAAVAALALVQAVLGDWTGSGVGG